MDRYKHIPLCLAKAGPVNATLQPELCIFKKKDISVIFTYSSATKYMYVSRLLTKWIMKFLINFVLFKTRYISSKQGRDDFKDSIHSIFVNFCESQTHIFFYM